MKRKCTIKSIMIRRSNEPGDFYFTWIAYVFRIRNDGRNIKKYDYSISPNNNKEYSDKLSAVSSGKRCITKIFGLEIIKLK